MESELSELTVGTRSELYDGNPPFKGHGAMSFAMSVSAVLRALDITERFEDEVSADHVAKREKEEK